MIKNDAEHEAALARIDEIFDATDGPEVEELAALVVDVVRYEEMRWPLDWARGEG